MLSCSACCAEPEDTLEAPPVTVQAERVLAHDDKEQGTFDDTVASEVFGKCAPAEVKDAHFENGSVGEAPAVAFTVRVEFAKGQSLGMSFDIIQSDNLRINLVDATGPIADYNSGASEELRVREGDYIMSVNGSSGDAKAKLGAMHLGGAVVLEIRRAYSFQVNGLDKSQGRLGLDLTFHGKSTAACIKKIFVDGLIKEHNQAHPDLEVRIGDLIVAVNGQRGGSRELVQLIGASDKLDLTIVRPLGH